MQLKQHIKKTSEGRKKWAIEYEKGGLDEKATGNRFSDSK